MTDFQHISKEEREEWLRSPVTAAAMAMLRELEAVATRSVLAASQSSDATLHAIALEAGKAWGLNSAIDQLTRMPK